MQFSKIAAVLSFAAAAVAAPAPVAVPEAALEIRTTPTTNQPPNACKVNGKYSAITQNCPSNQQYYCYQANGILSVLNIQCILNGNVVQVPINVVVGDISVDLLSKILAILNLGIL